MTLLIVVIGVTSCVTATPNSVNQTGNNTTETPQIGELAISSVLVSGITEKSVTATWKTNLPSTSELIATAQPSSVTLSSWEDKTLVLEHEATIEGLTASTEYKLKIVSKDATGNQAVLDIENSYETLTPRTAIGISVGEKIPDFSLKTVTGGNISSADFSGKRVIMVFWELSCKACREELVYIQYFYKNLPVDDLMLVTISRKEKEELIKNYINSQEYTFPVLLDTDGEVSGKYTIVTYPTILLIDTSGNIIKIKEGPFKSEKEINDFVVLNTNPE